MLMVVYVLDVDDNAGIAHIESCVAPLVQPVIKLYSKLNAAAARHCR